MSYLQVLLLAVVQGLTEFLPVSSSGHLVILQKFFHLSSPPVLFDIFVHVGTLGAILIYFKKDLLGFLKNWQKNYQFFLLIIIGTLPAAAAGVFLGGKIKLAFDSLSVVGVSLLVTALLLFSTRWLKLGERQFRDLKWHDAAFVGLFQALALLPGVSRAGSTIVASLGRGASRETAFRFSFYLAIPAIAGALILQIPDLPSLSSVYLKQAILGMFLSGVVGFFALRALEKVLKEAKLFWFGFYCLILGIILLLI